VKRREDGRLARARPGQLQRAAKIPAVESSRLLDLWSNAGKPHTSEEPSENASSDRRHN
jgi:hypothetical protein